MRSNVIFKSALKWYQSDNKVCKNAALQLFTKEELEEGVEKSYKCKEINWEQEENRIKEECGRQYPVGMLINYKGGVYIVSSEPYAVNAFYAGPKEIYIKAKKVGNNVILDDVVQIRFHDIKNANLEVDLDNEYNSARQAQKERIKKLEFMIKKHESEIVWCGERINEEKKNKIQRLDPEYLKSLL